jgi:hypothetical protein
MSRARRIYSPRPAAIKVGTDGRPLFFKNTAGRGVPERWAAVQGVREEWIVVDRWWSERPLWRHYFELLLADGQLVTVFCDARSGRWHRQVA